MNKKKVGLGILGLIVLAILIIGGCKLVGGDSEKKQVATPTSIPRSVPSVAPPTTVAPAQKPAVQPTTATQAAPRVPEPTPIPIDTSKMQPWYIESFEDIALGKYRLGSSFGEWTVGCGNRVDHYGEDSRKSSVSSRSPDLNGDGPACLLRYFSVTPGEKYVLAFDFAGNPFSKKASDPKVKEMAVLVDGLFVESFQADTTGRSVWNMGWTPKTVQLPVPLSNEILVEFRSTTLGHYGPSIDNVVIFGPVREIVPTPVPPLTEVTPTPAPVVEPIPPPAVESTPIPSAPTPVVVVQQPIQPRESILPGGRAASWLIYIPNGSSVGKTEVGSIKLDFEGDRRSSNLEVMMLAPNAENTKEERERFDVPLGGLNVTVVLSALVGAEDRCFKLTAKYKKVGGSEKKYELTPNFCIKPSVSVKITSTEGAIKATLKNLIQEDVHVELDLVCPFRLAGVSIFVDSENVHVQEGEGFLVKAGQRVGVIVDIEPESDSQMNRLYDCTLEATSKPVPTKKP